MSDAITPAEKYSKINMSLKHARFRFKQERGDIKSAAASVVTDNIIDEVIELTEQTLVELKELKQLRTDKAEKAAKESKAVNDIVTVTQTLVKIQDIGKTAVYPEYLTNIFSGLEGSSLYALKAAVSSRDIGWEAICNLDMAKVIKRLPVTKILPKTETDLTNLVQGIYSEDVGDGTSIENTMLVLEFPFFKFYWDLEFNPRNAFVVIRGPLGLSKPMPCTDFQIDHARVLRAEIEDFVRSVTVDAPSEKKV